MLAVKVATGKQQNKVEKPKLGFLVVREDVLPHTTSIVIARSTQAATNRNTIAPDSKTAPAAAAFIAFVLPVFDFMWFALRPGWLGDTSG